MFERLLRWFSPPVFDGDEQKTNNADLLNTILIAMGLFSIAGTVLVLLSSSVRWQLNLAFGGALVLAALALLILIRRGRVQLAAVILCLVLWALVTWQMIVDQGGIRGSTGTMFFLIIVIAGLFLSGRAVTAFGGLIVLTVIVLYVLEVREVILVVLTPVALLADLIVLELVFGFAILLLRVVVGRTADALSRANRNQAELVSSNSELREIRSSLERRISERTRGLQAGAEVSQATISILDVDELLPRVVDLVQERFDLYYVGLFLVDETGEWTRAVEDGAEPGRWVVLRAGTGAAGAQMIARVHRFEVGDPLSMIGRCVNEGDAKVALGLGLVSGRFSNPLLPETCSEVALPLRARGRVLGALSVQSTEQNAFDQDDIAVMQTISDQVGIAIDNARSFAAAEQALARSEAIARRYVQDTWDRFVEASADISGYRYASDHAGPTGEAWLPVMGEAVRRRDVAVQQHAGGDGDEQELSLAIPLIFGDAVIGTVGLRRPGDEPWSEEQIALVQDIGVQVAQTIETRRLFEETQRSARREVILRQTTERVRSQANLDALLQSAVQEIQRAVGATRVAIRLGTEPKGAPEDKGGRD